nr:uncharacterized protein LOC124494810 [Dermatophagoides farinae]
MPNPLNNNSGGAGNHNHLQYPQNNGTNNCPSNTSSPSSMNRRSTSKNPNGPPPPPPPTLPSHHRPSSSSYRRPIYSIANPNYSPYRSGRPPPQQSSNSYLKLHPTHNYPRYYSTSYPYCLSSSSSLPLQSSFTTFNSSVKLQQLGNRLQSWKTASIGISFLVLLLLICKLHDVDREINYLHYISNEWLSQQAVNHQLLTSSSSAAAVIGSGDGNAEPSKRRMDNHHHQPLDGHHDNNNDYDDNSHNLYSLVLNATINNTTTKTIINTKDNYSNDIFDEKNFDPNKDDLFNDLSPFTNYRLRPISSPIVAKRKSQPSENDQKLTSRHHHHHHHHHQQKSSTSIVDESIDHQQNSHHNNRHLKTQHITSHQQHRLSPVQKEIIHHHPNDDDDNDNDDDVEPIQELASASNHDVIELANIISIISYLKEDVDVLMSELMAARTTLLLSLVFVLVYILSWCWMAYAIRATNTPQDISLKTVLLLAIFAAVDIAASAGFVMVRIIMYLMRDHYFPRDMRIPLHSLEYNQLPAHVALRLTSMKSGTGVIDIFVSVIVTFLTSLRVYSVICAVSFYRRARKELLNVKNFEYMIERPTTSRFPSMIGNSSTNYLRGSMMAAAAASNSKPSPTNSTGDGGKHDSCDLGQSGYLPKIRLLSAHKDLERRFSINNGRNVHHSHHHHHHDVNVTNSSSDNNSTDISSADDDPALELKIQAADMPASIQKSAMQSTIHALRTYTTEKHIAESIKQNFDQLYEPTWHCIVGRNWGSCVTHTKSNYIRMLYKDLTILLYKSS